MTFTRKKTSKIKYKFLFFLHFNTQYYIIEEEVKHVKQSVYYADISWDMIIAILPKQDHVYEPVPKFPSVRRDLAMVIDTHVKFENLKKAALDTERQILKSVSIFDIYEGEYFEKAVKEMLALLESVR